MNIFGYQVNWPKTKTYKQKYKFQFKSIENLLGHFTKQTKLEMS